MGLSSGGKPVIFQARPQTSDKKVSTGFAMQEDVEKIYGMELGKCSHLFAKSLKKKTWCRSFCRAQQIPYYRIIYLIYSAADLKRIMPEVLDIIQTDFVKVSWGDTSLNVPRNHLYDALIEGCKNNMVSEPHCCVDIGEIIDAQIEGLSSMLQEGLILTEAYPQNLPHMKDGAVLPTTYATDKNGNKKGKKISSA